MPDTATIYIRITPELRKEIDTLASKNNLAINATVILLLNTGLANLDSVWAKS